jgi:hypothetical protein
LAWLGIPVGTPASERYWFESFWGHVVDRADLVLKQGTLNPGDRSSNVERDAYLNNLRTHLSLTDNVCGVVGYGLRNTEIDKLEPPTNKYEICRLEVTVYYPMLVSELHGFKHLFRKKCIGCPLIAYERTCCHVSRIKFRLSS